MVPQGNTAPGANPASGTFGRRFWLVAAVLALLRLAAWDEIRGAEPNEKLVSDARQALLRGVSYFHSEVAVHGGYVYYVSLDGRTRLGEGVASRDQVWVQPPGTPAVGLAMLRAYEVTQDPAVLKGARDAAEALIYGQLKSGGWRNAIDFDPQGTLTALYRNGRGKAKGANTSTLDDGATQTALLFLMRLDRATKFEDQPLHEAAKVGLDALLAAQFPNGAFPQVWTGPSAKQPVKPASYPDYEWRTENRLKEYWNLYTLNDQLAGDVTDTLLAAHEVYGDGRALAAIRRLGDFLILAQMPDPQPAWAQQYNYDMHPCWARKFEPPAVTANESQDVLETLMTIFEKTGDRKYLAPIPKAVAYLKTCVLSDGQLARFYELRTNKPLYMDRNYQLTFDDGDVPTHYGWKGKSRLESIEKRYNDLVAGKPARPSRRTVKPEEARRIVDALDDKGRWLTTYDGERITGQPKFRAGEQYLSSETFIKNVERLADFLSANK